MRKFFDIHILHLGKYLANLIKKLDANNSEIADKCLTNLIIINNAIKNYNINDFQIIDTKILEIVNNIEKQQNEYKLKIDSLINESLIEDEVKQSNFKNLLEKIDQLSKIKLIKGIKYNGSIILNNIYKNIKDIIDTKFDIDKQDQYINLINFYNSHVKDDFEKIEFINKNQISLKISKAFKKSIGKMETKINEIQQIKNSSKYYQIKSDEFIESMQEIQKQLKIIKKSEQNDGIKDITDKFYNKMGIDIKQINFTENDMTDAEINIKFNFIDLIENVPQLGFLYNKDITKIKKNQKRQFDKLKENIKQLWDENLIKEFKTKLNLIKKLSKFDKQYHTKIIQDQFQFNYEKLFNNIDQSWNDFIESERWEDLNNLISKIDRSNKDLNKTQNSIINVLLSKVNPLHEIFTFDELSEEHVISLKKLQKMKILSNHIPNFKESQEKFRLFINDSILNTFQNLQLSFELKNDDLLKNQDSFCIIKDFCKKHNYDYSEECDSMKLKIVTQENDFLTKMKNFPYLLDKSLKNSESIQKEYDGLSITKYNKLLSICNKINDQNSLIKDINIKFTNLYNNYIKLIEEESNNLLFITANDIQQIIQNIQIEIPNLNIDQDKKFNKIFNSIRQSEEKFKNEKNLKYLSNDEIDGIYKSITGQKQLFNNDKVIKLLNEKTKSQIITTLQSIKNEEYETMQKFSNSTQYVYNNLNQTIQEKKIEIDGEQQKIKDKNDFRKLVDSKLLKNIDNQQENAKNNLRNHNFKDFKYWFSKIVEQSRYNWSQFESSNDFFSEIKDIFINFKKTFKNAIDTNESKTIIEKQSFYINLAEFAQKELKDYIILVEQKEQQDKNNEKTQINMKDIHQIISNFPKYSQIQTNIEKQFNDLPEIIQEQSFSNEYEKIQEIYNLLLIENKDFENIITNLLKIVKEKITGRIQFLQSEIISNLSKEDLKIVDSLIFETENIEKIFSGLEGIINIDYKKEISKEILSYIKNIQDNMLITAEKYDTNEISKIISDEIVQNLIKMGRVYFNLSRYQNQAERYIDTTLRIVTNQGQTKVNEIGMLMEHLNKESNEEVQNILRNILSNFKQFKDINIISWNSNIKTISIEDIVSPDQLVIKDMQKNIANFEHRDVIMQLLKEQNEKYEILVHNQIKENGDINDLINIVKQYCQSKKSDISTENFSEEILAEIPDLLAQIFCIFTNLRTGGSYQENDELNPFERDKLLLKPHLIQVFSILQLLLPSKNKITEKDCYIGLKNKLCQIRTGEGKSIILGGMATLMALFGFEVSNICYSSDLCSRDRQEFADLFDLFEVGNLIRQMTIQEQYEEKIQLKLDLRKATQDLLNGKEIDTQSKAKKHQGRSVIIFDEVDFNFNQEFLKETQNISSEIRTPHFIRLIKQIQNNFKNDKKLNQISKILNTEEVNSIQREYPALSPFIETEIKLMIASLSDFDKLPYSLNKLDKKIQYKQNDSSSADVTYGYATMQNQLKEQDLGNLTESQLDIHLCMEIICGQFSYSDYHADLILGVSGTIDYMEPFQLEVLRQKNISEYAITPSVQGGSQLKYTGLTIQDTLSGQHLRIKELIQDITFQDDKDYRSVLVAFKSKLELQAFKKSEQQNKIIPREKKKNILTDELKPEDKNFIIRKAGTSGQITLIESIFLRGTDFIVYDHKVNKEGGMHLIMTQFPLDLSESEQAKGRTARQGKEGSYSFILNKNDLIKSIKFTENEMAGWADNAIFKNLCETRLSIIEKNRDESKDYFEKAKIRDEYSKLQLESLLSMDAVKSMDSLNKLYHHVNQNKIAHIKVFNISNLIIAFDTTGSMCGEWSSLQRMQIELFSRLKDMGIIEYVNIKLISYKDQDGGRLLEESSFSRDPTYLSSFITNIKCDNGGDREAVEWALNRCRIINNSQKVSKILLIGDAPPHNVSIGQRNQNNIVMQTDIKIECDQLKKLKIPVNTFRVRDREDTRKEFMEIAKLTDGKYKDLKKADDLLDLICVETLEDIGGVELVANYKEKYN